MLTQVIRFVISDLTPSAQLQKYPRPMHVEPDRLCGAMEFQYQYGQDAHRESMQLGFLAADVDVRGSREFQRDIEYKVGATKSLGKRFTGSTPTSVGYGVLAMSPYSAPKFLASFGVTQFLYEPRNQYSGLRLGHWEDNDGQITWLDATATEKNDLWRVAGPEGFGDVVFGKSTLLADGTSALRSFHRPRARPLFT